MGVVDVNVNLKTKDKYGNVKYRLLPRTLAENVVENPSKQFVSKKQIDYWNAKQEKINPCTREEIEALFGAGSGAGGSTGGNTGEAPGDNTSGNTGGSISDAALEARVAANETALRSIVTAKDVAALFA